MSSFRMGFAPVPAYWTTILSAGRMLARIVMESRYTWRNQLLFGLRSFAITASSVLVLTYLVVVSGQAAKEELEEMFVEERSQITHIDEPVVFGYEDGAKIWEVRSEVAEEEKESESSQLTRIYELILFKGGEENVLISGDHGDWDKPREKLKLTGNVVVESADGTTLLNTEVLIWEERTKTLACPEFVDFWVEDNHVIANSLYSADDLATIDFIGDVEMFVVGLEGENFITREGDFPLESVEDEEPGEGIYVLAEYVHYDKGDKLCQCFPFIPQPVKNLHHLDEEGRLLMEDPSAAEDPAWFLEDSEYVAALQQSIAEMDLSPEEQAFLAGETTFEELFNGDAERMPPDLLGGSGAIDPTAIIPGGLGLPGGLGPSGVEIPPGDGLGALAPGGRTSPFGITEDETPGANLPAIGEGPVTDILGPVVGIPAEPIELPRLPARDPNVVLTSPDYSIITGWDISPNLNAELFEGDPNFDPYEEMRDELVFCYRNDKKIWCEELIIDMAIHRIDALRQADARFRNLRDEDREPAEGRVGRAIQESPTQLIGNYLVHHWKANITEGFDRVLSIQPEKDIEADNVVFYEDSDVIHAWGDVLVHQYGGQWWAESGALEDIEDERAREDVRKPTVIRADAMLSYNERVSWGFGNVVFVQEKQTITSDRVQYEEATQMLVMAGNVDYESEDGEKLSCALLTMDLALEEYIAEGAAVARNIIPEEYRENLAEFRSDEDRQPEDDARTRLLENRTSAGLGDWSEAIENPPPPPPIEVLPGAEGSVETPPPLGPEAPPASFDEEQEALETPSDAETPPRMESINTGDAVPEDEFPAEDYLFGVAGDVSDLMGPMSVEEVEASEEPSGEDSATEEEASDAEEADSTEDETAASDDAADESEESDEVDDPEEESSEEEVVSDTGNGVTTEDETQL